MRYLFLAGSMTEKPVYCCAITKDYYNLGYCFCQYELRGFKFLWPLNKFTELWDLSSKAPDSLYVTIFMVHIKICIILQIAVYIPMNTSFLDWWWEKEEEGSTTVCLSFSYFSLKDVLCVIGELWKAAVGLSGPLIWPVTAVLMFLGLQKSIIKRRNQETGRC